MNQILELFPVVAFVATWLKTQDALVATAVLMIATLVQIILMRILKLPMGKMHKVTFAAVLVLGSATLLFRDEQFIQWKLTLINGIFAIILAVGHLIKKNFLQILFEAALSAQPDLELSVSNQTWHRLSLVFIFYFTMISATNAYVVTVLDFDTWINFRVGVFVVTLILFPATLIGFIMSENNQKKRGEVNKERPS